jgi:hypothetical protein
MLREVLSESEVPPFITYCESRGWSQINIPGPSLLDMRRNGREILTVSSKGPQEGVYVLYDEAARMAGEWREAMRRTNCADPANYRQLGRLDLLVMPWRAEGKSNVLRQKWEIG